ncbi:putative porin, partial [Parabacteroides distasonis]
YDECGDKQNGEDHIDAKFAVNAGKRLGLGFDINYAYARGYFSNQNTSHFGFTLYSSYLGDRYQMHAMLSTYNQKVAENGGLTDDAYITLPESFSDDFAPNEIPTVLEQNWNRNKHQHFFLTHRYNVGFYRLVPRTEEEIKARKFAAESKKENEERKAEANSGAGGRKPRQKSSDRAGEPMGRPEGALIMGD